jgi:hypothetical protein
MDRGKGKQGCGSSTTTSLLPSLTDSKEVHRYIDT